MTSGLWNIWSMFWSSALTLIPVVEWSLKASSILSQWSFILLWQRLSIGVVKTWIKKNKLSFHEFFFPTHNRSSFKQSTNGDIKSLISRGVAVHFFTTSSIVLPIATHHMHKSSSSKELNSVIAHDLLRTKKNLLTNNNNITKRSSESPPSKSPDMPANLFRN